MSNVNINVQNHYCDTDIANRFNSYHTFVKKSLQVNVTY